MRFAGLRRFVACAVLIALPCWTTAAEIKEGDFKASDGVKIHYYESGQGTPVVLVHGFTSSATGNWIGPGVFEALAKNHRVIALDCRNHGSSDKPNPGTPGRSKDVVELMDHLKFEKAHVHGYSMGGAIVGELLELIPDRLITAGFGGAGIFEVDPQWIAKMPPDKDDASGRAIPGAELYPRPVGGESAKAADSEKAGGAVAARARGALGRVNFNQPGVPRPGGPPGLDLKKVASIPMLVINGELDQPNQKSTRIAREVKDHKIVVVPGKTHMTTVRDPLFLQSTAEFIDAHDAK